MARSQNTRNGEQDTKTEEQDAKADAGPAIIVTARKSRRRAGLAFGTTPVRLKEGDLSEAQIKAIMDDPELTVRPATDED